MAVRLEVTPPSVSSPRGALSKGAERSAGGSGATTPEPLVYAFDQPRITIGRSASADVRLPSRTVSETHAILRLEDGAFVLVDQGSTNGTTHNGIAMVEGRRKLLRAGDRIEIAGYRVVFHEAVSIESSTSPEKTTGLARRIVREALGVLPALRRAPVIAVVAGPDVGARLTLAEPGCRLIVGRDDACDLRLTDADVSRQHLEVRRDWEGVSVRDLGSKNGMSVNGRKLAERRLRDRDEIAIASSVIAFEDAADVYLRELESGADEKVGATPSVPPGVEDGAAGNEVAGSSASDAAAGGSTDSPGSIAENAIASGAADAEKVIEPNVAPTVAAAAGAKSASVPLDPPKRARKRGGGRNIADVIVFLLAAVVLVGSVAALVVLLRAG